MDRKQAEALGWSFSAVGDMADGVRVDRVGAEKRFPDGGVSDVVGVDEAQVLRAIAETEQNEAQAAANRALAAKRAASEAGDSNA